MAWCAGCMTNLRIDSSLLAHLDDLEGMSGAEGMVSRDRHRMSESVRVRKALDKIGESMNILLPLCNGCIETSLEEIRADQERLNENTVAYSKAMGALEGEEEGEVDEGLLKALLEEEEELLQQLEILQQEEDELVKRNVKIEEDCVVGEKMEKEYWKLFQHVSSLSLQYCKDIEMVDDSLSYAAQHLDKIKRASVWNDSFHIWFDGQIGTINGMKLCRYGGQVDWDDLNAGLGYVVHLLHGIGKELKVEFVRVKPKPLGSFSGFIRLDDNSTLPLYGSSGDYYFSKYFKGKRFDEALVALLQCIQECYVYIVSLDKTVKLPHQIQEEFIDGVSIRFSNPEDEGWTKAMKYMLTDLKWVLSWAVKEVAYNRFQPPVAL